MFIAFSRHLFKSSGPHIDRLNMDGKGKRIHVVETGLGGPDISVFYDEELRRVFWTDPQNEEISSASVDGKNNGLKILLLLFKKLVSLQILCYSAWPNLFVLW
jgi:hypothetical protein